VWLGRIPIPLLRDQLRHWQFWALEIQFTGLLALTWTALPPLLRSLGLRRGDLAVPAVASLVALGLAAGVAPRTSRIYYDEQIYQSIGQNLSDLHLAQMCNDGTVEYGRLQCVRSEYNKEPYGYPYLLSVAFRLTGVHESVAFLVNPLIGALAIWVIYLIAFLLTERLAAAEYAAMVAALIPDQIRWAHTTSAEPSAAFMCAGAVLTALAFVRLRSTPALLWMIAASAFAIQFRPECILVLPIVGIIIATFARDELLRPRLWWAVLAGLLLSSIHVGHLLAVRGDAWGTTGARLSTSFLRGNLRTNGWFYLGDPRFPIVYSLLALIAVATWKPRRAILIPILYFGLFGGIFLFFYAGSYNYGADDRYSLMTYAPIAVLAGAGLSRVADTVARQFTWRARSNVRLALGLALVVQFLWYVPFVRAVGEEAWGARADVAFARDAARDLPANSLVLTHNPNMFHVWGRNAAQLSFASTEPYYGGHALAGRYAGGVFLHWNFWCNVPDPQQHGFCAKVLDSLPHTLVREYRERNYRFAMYRLDLGAATKTAADR
jgi:dolichyl-phosphate-mannose-protein mannosyltransferase